MIIKPWWNRRKPINLEQVQLRTCLSFMIGGAIGFAIAALNQNFIWMAVTSGVFAAGVAFFDR